MSMEKHDPFLVAIEGKIVAWTAVRDSYIAATLLDSSTLDPPVDTFRRTYLKEAILLYLRAGQRRQTAKQIAAGLLAGGYPTMSKSFDTIVGNTLGYLKRANLVLRFPDGWDVAP